LSNSLHLSTTNLAAVQYLVEGPATATPSPSISIFSAYCKPLLQLTRLSARLRYSNLNALAVVVRETVSPFFNLSF
jgi:hypothetical protein